MTTPAFSFHTVVDLKDLVAGKLNPQLLNLQKILRDGVSVTLSVGEDAVSMPKALGLRARGDRRTDAEMDEFKAQVLEFIKSNPGSGATAINLALGTTTKELSLPVRKLLEDGEIHSEGQRRGMVYHPGAAPSSKKAAGKKSSNKKSGKKSGGKKGASAKASSEGPMAEAA